MKINSNLRLYLVTRNAIREVRVTDVKDEAIRVGKESVIIK
jgi:hypothetical protein